MPGDHLSDTRRTDGHRWWTIPLLLVALASSCLFQPDQPVENVSREPLRVLEVDVEDGETDVEINRSIRVSFNQPLDPESLGNVEMRLSSGSLNVAHDVRYDAITRTLVLDPRSNLRSDLWYLFELTGFPLSIMGTAYLGEDVEIAFRTGTHTVEEPGIPGVGFEDDVWPALRGCACHGPENPVMGYAIVYDDAETYLERGVATPSNEWRNWLVVDPGHHESSYLLYKVLGDERLGMPTVRGETMPPPPWEPLSMQEVESIRTWIDQGAGL